MTAPVGGDRAVDTTPDPSLEPAAGTDGRIPEFPVFRLLTRLSRREYEARVAMYEAHSPFNFTCLWTWNADGRTAVSSLYGNLVVRQVDYATSLPFASFIGASEPARTAAALLDWAPSVGLLPVLRWVPEESVEALVSQAGQSFEAREDAANNDYVYELARLVSLEGRRLERRRQGVRAFTRKLPAVEARRVAGDDPGVRTGIEAILAAWWDARWQHEAPSKEAAQIGARRDLAALGRCLELERRCGLELLGAYLSDELIGFTIFERRSADAYLGHYLRAHPRLPGLSDFLLHESARVMHSSGALWLNLQEDLGNEGLRTWKRSWQPVRFLRKFDVWRRP